MIPSAASCLVELAPCPARAGHRTRSAAVAAAAAFYLVGAAARATALKKRFGELAELNLRLVGFRQPLSVLLELSRHVAQKVKVQALAIEQMFDIDQHGRYTFFREHC